MMPKKMQNRGSRQLQRRLRRPARVLLVALIGLPLFLGAAALLGRAFQQEDSHYAAIGARESASERRTRPDRRQAEAAARQIRLHGEQPIVPDRPVVTKPVTVPARVMGVPIRH